MSEDCVCDFGKEKGSFTIEARSALRSERVFINTEIQYCTSFRNLIRKSQNPSWNLTRSHRSHRSVPASSGVPSSTPCARRLSQPLCNYSDSTGIRSRAPTAAPRDARPPLLPSHVVSSHGQPFARNHCSTSRCPPNAANAHVSSLHGQPFARAHCSTSRRPYFAAKPHVHLSHGQPFARAHCSTSRCPPSAAPRHVSVSHGQPFARAHCSTSR